jgi:hypothetical protein
VSGGGVGAPSGGARIESPKDKNLNYMFKDPPAMAAPKRYQKALSIPLQPNHTINTINSNTYHLLEKVTKIHKDRSITQKMNKL